MYGAYGQVPPQQQYGYHQQQQQQQLQYAAPAGNHQQQQQGQQYQYPPHQQEQQQMTTQHPTAASSFAAPSTSYPAAVVEPEGGQQQQRVGGIQQPPPTIYVDTQHDDMVHDAQLDYYGTKLATGSSGKFGSPFPFFISFFVLCGGEWMDMEILREGALGDRPLVPGVAFRPLRSRSRSSHITSIIYATSSTFRSSSL